MRGKFGRGLVAATLAIAAAGSVPTGATAEESGAVCDIKVSVNLGPYSDDGLEFYASQQVSILGFGYPPGDLVILRVAWGDREPYEGDPHFHAGEDGTFSMGFGSFPGPEGSSLPPDPVLLTVYDDSNPDCADSVTMQFVGNLPYFKDYYMTMHDDAIIWMAESGLSTGCGPERFCPRRFVTRGEMATFLVRALELPGTETDYFADDDGTKYEWSINRLAEAGIATGCAADAFCPARTLTRGEMASSLVRAFAIPPSDIDRFTDDDVSTHEAAINALAAAGITTGCRGDYPYLFCTYRPIYRDQMAAFLYRIMN